MRDIGELERCIEILSAGEARVVKNQSVRADAFEISGLSVAVMPVQAGEGLLGQNFLRHFEVSQSAATLRLRMRGDGPN